MNPVGLLSFAAFVVAAVPPTYFAVVLRRANPTFARLAGLLAAALLVHAAFHIAPEVGVPEGSVHWLEAASAVLILAFAISYWQVRRRETK